MNNGVLKLEQRGNGAAIIWMNDPDHPVNQGSLCSKGAALYQVANNKLRLKKVKYRAPGTSRPGTTDHRHDEMVVGRPEMIWRHNIELSCARNVRFRLLLTSNLEGPTHRWQLLLPTASAEVTGYVAVCRGCANECSAR